MKAHHFFYNCSKEYIDALDKQIVREIDETIDSLSKRDTQAELNKDILLSLCSKGWAYDSAPTDAFESKPHNIRNLCLTSTTLGAGWHADFAKQVGSGLVQLEVQFGKVESMFKDFCGFRIAYFERRLALGIEVVMYDPNSYFSHRKSAVNGMAYFDIAKRALPAIGLDCPIWLIGLSE